MGLRHRSIRLRVGILVIVPVLCLIGLYAFAAGITLGGAQAQARAETIMADLITPVSNFQSALATERHLAVLDVASPMNMQVQSQLGAQEARTQRALTALTAPRVTANASPAERTAIRSLFSQADHLSYLRSEVSADAISMIGTLTAYDAIESAGFTVLDEALDSQSDAPLVTQGLNVVNLDRAMQTALAESDLLAGDIAQLNFPAGDRLMFAELANERQALISATLPELQPTYRALVTRSLTPAVSHSLATVEAAVISTPWRQGAPPAKLVADAGAFTTYSKALNTALGSAVAKLQSQAQNAANSVFLLLILAAGLGLLGIIASIALSLVIGRGLVRQLHDLRESALTLAHDKLPSVIGQLRAGQQVDVAEYAPGQVPTNNEIEQVQHAFSVVQQTAIQSAVDEARLRRGISDVFRNLAGRSQSLLHRQLTLLDGMERRATEPDELEDLFRIDHLTTRMRRHAEGLIILSGDAPARGWRQPVPLVDVLRAAVAEVEDYTRIRVLCRTGAAVAGHAVADVIHLVAELAENATVFSPPNTPVRIQGDIVGRGFAVEIEDRGLGISQARLDEINANLANPPQFDLSGSDRLGLFIAGQLAQRHDIRISLRPSVYGGTTAIVLIPTPLVVEEDSYARDPALPAGRGNGAHQDRVSGRHALIQAPDRIRQAGLLPAAGPAADYAGFSLALTGRVTTEGEPIPPAAPVSANLTAEAGQDAVAAVSADLDAHVGQDAAARVNADLDASVSEDADPRVTTGELAELGLPVRVRQASMAPQLRDSQPAAPPLARRPGNGSVAARSFAAQSSLGPPSAAAPAASPEAARNTMSALQRGWQLGRAEAGEAFDRPEPEDATGSEQDDQESRADQEDGVDQRDGE